MPTTLERPAPSMPDNLPDNDELQRIIHGDKQFTNDGSPHEPDEIVYADPKRGTWVTTRDERARAAHIWNEEKQAPYPQDAAESLKRTEDMIRARLSLASAEEAPAAIADLLTVHEERLRRIGATAQRTRATTAETAAQPDWVDAPTGEHIPTPDWADAATGQFVLPKEQAPSPTQEPASEYVGRHRERANKRSLRMRIPLHRLIKHRSSYKARHAAE